jgi:hypothetical protein
MPRKRLRAKARWDVTSDQKLELVFDGPSFGDEIAFSEELPQRLRSCFETPILRRAAWFKHREELMASRSAGSRPGGFWWYEARERPREGESQADCLKRLGLLEPWEEAQLAAWESIRRSGDGALSQGSEHAT